MSRSLSRRRLIIAGGAASLGAAATGPRRVAAVRRPAVVPAETPAGPLVVLFEPFRAFDSRTDAVPLGGAKLRSGESVAVTVPVGQDNGGFAVAAFVNCTIVDT